MCSGSICKLYIYIIIMFFYISYTLIKNDVLECFVAYPMWVQSTYKSGSKNIINPPLGGGGGILIWIIIN